MSASSIAQPNTQVPTKSRSANRPLERIHLEVTNVCNFKCEFCPDAIMERKRGHMDIDLLEKALDEIADHNLAKIVAFHLMGEPLIYPHIFDAIEMAIARQLNLHLTTNGSTFHIRPEHIEKLSSLRHSQSHHLFANARSRHLYHSRRTAQSQARTVFRWHHAVRSGKLIE